MLNRSSVRYTISALLVFGCVVFGARGVDAATLSFSPGSTSVSTGNIVSVRAIVSTDGKAINSADGTITFPTDLLDVISVNKNSSIFSLWVEDPKFSNYGGTITFDGGVPNPGFTGQSGEVLSIVFKAKKSGNATIVYSDAAVRANDGLGTDVLNAKVPGSIAISTTVIKPIPAVVLPVVATSSELALVVAPPVISSYPSTLNDGGIMHIEGTALGSATVEVIVEDDKGHEDSQRTETAANGSFTVTWNHALDAGPYTLRARAIDATTIKSEFTTPVSITVESPVIVRVNTFVLNWLSLLILVLAAIGCLVLLVMYFVHRHAKMKHSVGKDIRDVETSMHKAFDLLRENVRDQVKTLEKARTKRSLTKEEEKVIKELQENLEKSEAFLEQKITRIEEIVS
jgi:hypothetical protein